MGDSQPVPMTPADWQAYHDSQRRADIQTKEQQVAEQLERRLRRRQELLDRYPLLAREKTSIELLQELDRLRAEYAVDRTKVVVLRAWDHVLKIVGDGHWVEVLFHRGYYKANGKDTEDEEEMRTWISLNKNVESCGQWVIRMGPGHILAPYSYGRSAGEAFGHMWKPLAPVARVGEGHKKRHPILCFTKMGNLAGGYPLSSQTAECLSCGFKSSYTWRTCGRPTSTRCQQCSRVRDDPLEGRNGKRTARVALPLKIRFQYERFV